MLKQVVLPAPFGPISASIRRLRPRRNAVAPPSTPPKRFAQGRGPRARRSCGRAHPRPPPCAALSPASGSAGIRARRRRARAGTGRPAHEDARPKRQARHQLELLVQPDEGEGADDRPGQRSARRRAAPSAAHRPSAGSPYRSGRRSPWTKAKSPPAMPAAKRGDGEGRPIAVPRTSMPIASARSGLSRPARSA